MLWLDADLCGGWNRNLILVHQVRNPAMQEPPPNAGVVNVKKTYENASTMSKHEGLQQIILFGKTYG